MSDFLKLAYELISAIFYNLSACFVGLFNGLYLLFVKGWGTYATVVGSYFGELDPVGKILTVLLIVILVAIPLGLLFLLIRRIILGIRLKSSAEDNVTLFKEIGRLNKQVMELMDEKNKILALKVGGGVSNLSAAALASGEGLESLELEGGTAGVVTAGGALSGDVVAAAAAAAAKVKSKADEEELNTVHRFPKLQLVDEKYVDFAPPEYDTAVSLQDFTEGYRLFAASQMHLYYTPEIVRRFVAGMAASKILILEGISGTGKTSLPYSFSRYLDNPATMVSVQPSYRDRTELLGYFNEFSKRFNETEFLRALYEAGYREDPTLIVLDEMNLARIEYYFAEMLSVLELPNENEWTLDLVPTAWPGDPKKMAGGKIWVSPRTWFVGTANNDDSTFTITDKVYDRAMPIELNERAAPFECEDHGTCHVTAKHLMAMFEKAKEEHPISEATMARMVKMNDYLLTRFKLAFGNRIMKQLYDFIPVYVACGGNELDGLDYILARKVLKKFETQNVSFVRDEISGLLEYMERIFGKDRMPDSVAYLLRIQNLY